MILIPRRWAQVAPNTSSVIARATNLDPETASAAIADWESAVAKYVGAPHAVAVNSGRQGMLACLQHFEVGPGTEVIVPAYTLGSLIPLITGLGAAAVPADIDPDTLNVTADSVRARLSGRTRAILVLHAFGNPAPIEAIAALGREKGIAVIEDCAHALGAKTGERALGTLADAGFYSFEPTKPINTYGGGMVVTGHADLAGAIRAAEAAKPFDYPTLHKKVDAVRKEQLMVRSSLAWPVLWFLGWPPTRSILSKLYRSAQSVPKGAFRYTPAQAELGRMALEQLDARLAERNELARHYQERLGARLSFQAISPEDRATQYMLIARIPGGAAKMKRWLLGRAIDCAAGDEIADDCAAPNGYDDCPEAARAFREALALPLFEGMPMEAVDRVSKALMRGLDRNAAQSG